MWDLWWTKWHWARFFPEYFGFFLSVTLEHCSIHLFHPYITDEIQSYQLTASFNKTLLSYYYYYYYYYYYF